MTFAVQCFNSPVGILSLFEIDQAVCALEWGRPPEDIPSPFLAEAINQMNDYFDGKRKDFDLTFKPVGTHFQLRLWKSLQEIPFGTVITYGDLAKKLNSSPRAVGMACAQNPIPIFIPCHRVIASDLYLKGYSGEGGIKTKQFLLEHENVRVQDGRVVKT